MNQNTDELWESLVLEQFPNANTHSIKESKWQAALSWGIGDKTVMSEIYDKYVMMKRLRGIEPGENDGS